MADTRYPRYWLPVPRVTPAMLPAMGGTQATLLSLESYSHAGHSVAASHLSCMHAAPPG